MFVRRSCVVVFLRGLWAVLGVPVESRGGGGAAGWESGAKYVISKRRYVCFCPQVNAFLMI